MRIIALSSSVKCPSIGLSYATEFGRAVYFSERFKVIMKPENLKRDNKGHFIPQYKTWSLSNFNEGHLNKQENRFIVRVPGHLKSRSGGWVFRSIVAYEAYHNEIVLQNYDIHHTNENKLDDSEENLRKMTHGEHSSLHHKGKSHKGQNAHLKTGKDLICPVCNIIFYRAAWELKKVNYCSTACYYKRNLKECRCFICKKAFKRFAHKIKKYNFCSKSCASRARNIMREL